MLQDRFASGQNPDPRPATASSHNLQALDTIISERQPASGMTLSSRQRLSGLLTGLLALAFCMAAKSALAAVEHRHEPVANKNPQLLVPAGVFDATDGKIHRDWVVLVT